MAVLLSVNAANIPYICLVSQAGSEKSLPMQLFELVSGKVRVETRLDGQSLGGQERPNPGKEPF